ncbi:HD-GYP domain-containing protein [Natronincola peptidivorans]|nr:HD-GYP domain-containing protein [Natronincola peptidivorans]
MIKINISVVIPGMILAKPIFDKQGKLLIDKGMELKQLYIDKLKKHQIKYIYISWDKNVMPEVNEVITKETRQQALNIIKETINNIHISKEIDIVALEAVITEIITDLMSEEGILINLSDMRTIDEYTFEHSVNVCILSLMMGIALKYSKDDLKAIGVGALLHDIGKIYISDAILNKPQLLTEAEYEEIKRHALLGYEMTETIKGLKEEIRWIIRDHHERYDGTGYPNRLWGNNIHIFPRIVAICDVYDALTSNRVYRNGIPIHQAIEYLIAMGNHQFDYNLVKVFLKNICIYPVGTLVKLQTGESGVVIHTDENWPTRPIIEIIADDTGKPMGISKKIDLTKNISNGIACRSEVI